MIVKASTTCLKVPAGTAAIGVLLSAMLVGHASAQSGPELAEKAAQAMQAGTYPTAEDLYSQLSKLMPEVAEVHSNLGLARYYQKKFTAAEPEFRAALRLKPDLF